MTQEERWLERSEKALKVVWLVINEMKDKIEKLEGKKP